MVQSTIRFAAGAGVVAASLLIVGPCPAPAVADEGGSSSQEPFGRDSADDDSPDSSIGADSKSAIDGPMNLGTGASDLEDLAVADSIAPDGPVTLRSAAVEEEPAGVNASGAAPRSGSDNARPPTVSAGSPRVVVGNGRSPGVQDHDRDSEPVRETPVAPAVPVAIEVTIAPLPPPLPPVERIQPPRLVFGEMGTAKIATTTDPLFGLAGLLLIPAVGAALGYRQARAAQSVRESVRP